MKKYILALISSLPLSINASDVKPEDFIQQSYKGLQEISEVNSKAWGFGSEQTWSVDFNNGKILFIFEDKTVEADVQVVGTMSRQGTFMWGWDHPSVKGTPSEHAKLVKAYGEKNKLDEITTRIVPMSEQRAWELTALTMRVGENMGAYRGNAGGGTLVYMTFGEITIKPKS